MTATLSQRLVVDALLVDCKRVLHLLQLSHQDCLCADLMKHMEAVERAFKEPSNVIRIGDHDIEFRRKQAAVASEMERRDV